MRPLRSHLRIVHTTVPDTVGGLESVVQGLAIGQHRRGHDVRVLAVIGHSMINHPFAVSLLDAGVPVALLRLRRRDYVGEWRQMGKFFREFQPDIVHTHGYRSDLLDATVARLHGFATVTTVHGSSRMGGGTPLYEWVQTRAFRWFDAVISVSIPLLDLMDEAGVPRDRVVIIPNAWAGKEPVLGRTEARRKLGIPEEGIVIGFVGRLISIKGCDVFLKAISRLTDLPFTVSVVGDGSERAALERLSHSIGIGNRITFHGSVDSAFQLFPAFDLYALTSRSEGTPMVLFESMAARVPIVASLVGGVPAVLGDTALLVPPEDPEALAAALRQVLEDQKSARERAEKARHRLETIYSSDTWLDQHDEVYQRIRRFR